MLSSRIISLSIKNNETRYDIKHSLNLVYHYYINYFLQSFLTISFHWWQMLVVGCPFFKNKQGHI